jgi:hypothetical protein
MQKIKQWAGLFLFAELCGTICSVVFAYCTHHFFETPIITAYSGAIGENIGFYSVLWYKEYKICITKSKNPLWKSGLNLVSQFGFIEIVDSFITRPYSMYLCTTLLPINTGIIIGKLIADLVFYSLAIGIKMFFQKKVIIRD